MPIQVYNSLTRTKEPFTPVVPGKVSMYVCGPTVYSDCHIGHTMGPVLFDAVARWFGARNYAVTFINNITDIEDKIINRANETGEPWQDITERYAQQYFGLLKDLAVTTVSAHPRCTEYVPGMIEFIEDLISKDRAYVAEDGVYFDIQAQAKYGKLAGRDLEPAREDITGGLRHQHDFALWKLAKPDEPSWASPWGEGRPGWHIECSVMSSSLLGGEFDIHGGGEELKFPHHDNEIAQSEAHGDNYARCWMHNGLCQYDGAKISKSDPRMRDPAFAQQFQALFLIKTYGGEALRFHILRGHYRRPQEFKPEGLKATLTTLERMRSQLFEGLGDVAPLDSLDAINAVSVPPAVAAMRERFCTAMDDDFNTGAALGQLAGILAQARKADDDTQTKAILSVAYGLASLLGLLARGLNPAPDAVTADPAAVAAVSAALSTALESLPAWLGDAHASGAEFVTALQATSLDDLCPAPELAHMPRPSGERDQGARFLDDALRLRQLARAQRDFALGDAVRDAFATAGLTVRDGKDGSSWS